MADALPNAVPVPRLHELLDDYRDVALLGSRSTDLWIALANLVAFYEEGAE